MEKRIALADNEATLLRGYFAGVDAAKRELAIAAGMVLAREGVTVAVIEDLQENELIVTIP